jgi:hypothetical protein
VLSTANADGILQQRLKDTLEIERRAADELELIGSGDLLLQRFGQIVSPCERALNPPQLWASNFPQFCRGG